MKDDVSASVYPGVLFQFGFGFVRSVGVSHHPSARCRPFHELTHRRRRDVQVARPYNRLLLVELADVRLEVGVPFLFRVQRLQRVRYGQRLDCIVAGKT